MIGRGVVGERDDLAAELADDEVPRAGGLGQEDGPVEHQGGERGPAVYGRAGRGCRANRDAVHGTRAAGPESGGAATAGPAPARLVARSRARRKTPIATDRAE